jgi:peptidoglycan-associated lipoprotein
MKLSRVVVKSTVFASALFFTAVGCTSDETDVNDAVTSDQKLPAEVKNQNNDFSIDDKGNVKFSTEVIYFKFDDHSLTDQGRSQLMALAEYLGKNKGKLLKVQGHSDERGSTEYNLALGQLRTKAVIKYLQDLGLEDKRLAAVSYGEEKPADGAHSEAAWSKNRRADFVITGI